MSTIMKKLDNLLSATAFAEEGLPEVALEWMGESKSPKASPTSKESEKTPPPPSMREAALGTR